MSEVRQYTIVIFHEMEGGYSVAVPALPGCHTQGDDLAEALDMVKEAIALHLDCLAEHGEPIPDDLPEVSVELLYAHEALVCKVRVPPLEQLPPVAFVQLHPDAEPPVTAGQLWRVLKAAGIPEEEVDRLLQKIAEEDAAAKDGAQE